VGFPRVHAGEEVKPTATSSPLGLPAVVRTVPAFRCHEEVVDHDAERWPVERREEPAVLCGCCGTELAVQEHLGADACPDCEAAFDPACADHDDRYFEPVAGAEDG